MACINHVVDQNGPKEETMNSKQSATIEDARCPHGFSSCTEYMTRLLYVYADMRIVWTKGDLEDTLVKRIDETELQIRGVWDASLLQVEYEVWIQSSFATRANNVELLQSMLIQRLDESGKIPFFTVKGFERTYYDIGIDLDYVNAVIDEQQRWEKAHGIDLSRSTSFILRSSLVATSKK